jgi:hypothetical protein
MATEPPTRNGFFRSGVARWVVLAAAIVIVAILATALWPQASPTSSSHPNAGPTSQHSIPGESPTPTPSNSSSSVPVPGKDSHEILRGGTPVGILSTATPVSGLTVHISKMKAVNGTASGPGEVAAPSVQYTLIVENDTGNAVSLGSVVINGYYGADNTPAAQLDGPGSVALPSSVSAGKSVTTVYVFSIPKSQRGTTTVTFDYSTAVPVIVLTGAAPS